jgi:Leucine-rich repeat (LRR) protein
MNVVNNIIQRNRFDKSESLDISYKGLSKCPDLSEHIWLKTISLKGNSLKEIEEGILPPNLETIDLSNNDFDDEGSLNLPQTITTLILTGNSFYSFDCSFFPNLKNLNLSNNELYSVEKFNNCLEEIDLSHNSLECFHLQFKNTCDMPLDKFPSSLKKIDLSGNKLNDLTEINDGLIGIDISCNDFDDLPIFPDSLEILICSQNSIKEVCYPLPTSLTKLDLSCNELENITIELPPSLERIDLSYNNIDKIPDLPTELKYGNFSDNKIRVIENIPINMIELDISNNYITDIPIDIKKNVEKIYSTGNTIENEESSSSSDDGFWNLYGDNTIDSDNEDFKPFNGEGRATGYTNNYVNYNNNNTRSNYGNYGNTSNTYSNYGNYGNYGNTSNTYGYYNTNSTYRTLNLSNVDKKTYDPKYKIKFTRTKIV